MAKLTRVTDALVWVRSQLAGAVQRLLEEKLTDSISVKDFGARGDWNTYTQTGTNDTAAFQQCINTVCSLGNRRSGGKLAIRIPAGVYRLDSLTVPVTVGFGVEFIGDGQLNTCLRFPSGEGVAITIPVEMCKFRDMAIFGALADTPITERKAVGVKVHLESKRIDCDLWFDNVIMQYFTDCTEIHGRGCVFNNCMLAHSDYAINVVCDDDAVFTPNSEGASFATGMRHYTLRGSRTDGLSRFLRVTGSGIQKDYINDILIDGNDFLVMDRLIDAADATLRRVTITNNNAMLSFTTGAVVTKGIAFANISSNNFSKEHDDHTARANSMQYLINATGGVTSVNITGNILRGIRQNLVRAGTGYGITIANNQLPKLFKDNTDSVKILVYCPSSIKGLIIKGNTVVAAPDASGTYRLHWTAQDEADVYKEYNMCEKWKWIDAGGTYTPVVSGGGMAASYGEYVIRDGYCEVDFMLHGTSTAASGDITFSLPVTPVAMNSSITGTYSGGGTLYLVSGMNSTLAKTYAVQVRPATGAVIVSVNAGNTTSVQWSDRTASVVQMYGRLRYKV